MWKVLPVRSWREVGLMGLAVDMDLDLAFGLVWFCFGRLSRVESDGNYLGFSFSWIARFLRVLYGTLGYIFLDF